MASKAKPTTNKTAWTITTIIVVAVFVIAIVCISLNKKETNTKEEETLKTRVIIFDWKGDIQKSLKFRVWKQKEGYTENIYKGGQIVLEIASTNNINYNLTSGENCLFSVDEFVIQTGILKDDSVTIDNNTPGTKYPYNPTNLCIKLENSDFVDWKNINPATIDVKIYELV